MFGKEDPPDATPQLETPRTRVPRRGPAADRRRELTSGRRFQMTTVMNPVRIAAEVRDQWVAGLTPPPTANGAQGAAGEHLVLHLLRTTSIPILRPNPERTWVWSDLHLGDPSVLDAWDRPFRNVRHMNRALLAEWRRRVRPGDTIICLGDVAHFDAWHDDSRLRLHVAGCPGERVLILGNHDIYSRAELAAAVCDQQYAAAVCDTDPLLVLTHSPLRRVPPNTVNIHRHLHGGRGPTGRHRNLSIERTGYRPLRLDEILADATSSESSPR